MRIVVSVLLVRHLDSLVVVRYPSLDCRLDTAGEALGSGRHQQSCFVHQAYLLCPGGICRCGKRPPRIYASRAG